MKLICTRGVMIKGEAYAPGDLLELDNGLASEMLATGKVVPADTIDRSIGITEEPAPVKKTTRKRSTKKAE